MSERLRARLASIAAYRLAPTIDGFPASGYFKCDKPLCDAGLCRVWEETRPAFGGMSMTVKFIEPTDAGWAALACLPVMDRQVEFLSRRAGCCVPDFPPLRSCLARGWVEIIWTNPNGSTVRWKRTDSGREAARDRTLATPRQSAPLES
jgi:hypothetical protein